MLCVNNYISFMSFRYLRGQPFEGVSDQSFDVDCVHGRGLIAEGLFVGI